MKARIFDHRNLWAWLAAVALVAAIGCSEDNGNGNGPGEGSVSITTIIVNPKTADLGDTLTVTVALEGEAPPGEFASVTWTNTGGEFLTDNATAVDWVAPDVGGVFRLTCRAISGQSSDEGFVDVFVGEPSLSVNENAGEVILRPAPGEFYYLRSVPSEGAWDSSQVYIQQTGVPEPVLPGVRLGAQFAFSSGLNRAAYVVNSAGGAFNLDPLDIFVIDLNARTERKITTDGAEPGSNRRHQYEHPYFSPDENWITYEGFLPNPQAGTTDTLDVFVYDLINSVETNVSIVGAPSGERVNLFPTYSSDSEWLVWVSDRGQRNQWDLFGVKLNAQGGIAGNTQQLTTGALVGLSTPGSLGRPLLTWNPSQPILALVGAAGSDGGLHLVTVTDAGATAVAVTDVGDEVQEIAWSDDGQTLAVSGRVPAPSGEGMINALFTVTPAGNATQRHTAGADDIVDMGWSPDGEFLVYRVVHGADSWIELIDIDGGTNYPLPPVISKAASDGLREAYSSEMSTAAQYGAGNTVVYILFDEDLTPSETPTIWTLDVSTAVQP